MGHVFASYARDDEEFVLPLMRGLQTRGVNVWLDQWHIPASADWDQAIDDALYDCEFLVIVLSLASVKSREVRGELRTAFDENKPILPILLEECRIPRNLKVLQLVDFTSRSPDDAAGLAEIAQALGAEPSVTRETATTEPQARNALLGAELSVTRETATIEPQARKALLEDVALALRSPIERVAQLTTALMSRRASGGDGSGSRRS